MTSQRICGCLEIMFEQTPIQPIRAYTFGLVCEMAQLMTK